MFEIAIIFQNITVFTVFFFLSNKESTLKLAIINREKKFLRSM